MAILQLIGWLQQGKQWTILDFDSLNLFYKIVTAYITHYYRKVDMNLS